MQLTEIIERFNALFPKPPVSAEGQEQEIERRIVAKYGSGNPFLQLGMYITEEDIERERNEILNHIFFEGE